MSPSILILRLSACVMCLFLASGCVTHGAWAHDPYPVGSVHVPPGHMPPPGQCRIWFPARPPGHQSPPGDCHELRYRVPSGAVLVEG